MRDLTVRLWGVVRKEVVELIRQPGLLGILVVGPLVILLLFGAGVRPTDPAVRALFVTPEDSPEVAGALERFADAQDERLTVVGITEDEASALARLATGEVELVVAVPDGVLEDLERGDRPTVRVIHRFIDPLEAQAMELFTITGVDEINDLLLERVIAEAQDATGEVVDEAEALADTAVVESEQEQEAEQAVAEAEELVERDPRSLARPLRGEAVSVGGSVTTSQFYAPAVVALILQHLILTFVALSMGREREQGTIELTTVSPLRPVEGMLGKVVAYLLVGCALSTVLIAAVALLLEAPVRAGVGPVALVLVLEMLASVGLGFLLAGLARTTTQVVQGAMLLLLLSVFFGGLLLSADRLLPWVRPAGWALPMTPTILLLRDSMLRGTELAAGQLAWLAGLAGGLMLIGGALALRQRASA